MLFNSLDFAVFLPIVFALYWFVTNHNLKLQNALIVLASYVFSGYKSFLYGNVNNVFYNKGIVLPFTNTYSLAYELYSDYTFEQLNRIQKITPAQIIFVTLPKFNLLNNSNIYAQYQNSLYYLNDQIIVVNILDLFIGYSNDKFSFHENDHHPNSKAVLIIFQETQRNLVELSRDPHL